MKGHKNMVRYKCCSSKCVDRHQFKSNENINHNIRKTIQRIRTEIVYGLVVIFECLQQILEFISITIKTT